MSLGSVPGGSQRGVGWVSQREQWEKWGKHHPLATIKYLDDREVD